MTFHGIDKNHYEQELKEQVEYKKRIEDDKRAKESFSVIYFYFFRKNLILQHIEILVGSPVIFRWSVELTQFFLLHLFGSNLVHKKKKKIFFLQLLLMEILTNGILL